MYKTFVSSSKIQWQFIEYFEFGSSFIILMWFCRLVGWMFGYAQWSTDIDSPNTLFPHLISTSLFLHFLLFHSSIAAVAAAIACQNYPCYKTLFQPVWHQNWSLILIVYWFHQLRLWSVEEKQNCNILFYTFPVEKSFTVLRAHDAKRQNNRKNWIAFYFFWIWNENKVCTHKRTYTEAHVTRKH